MKLFPIKNPVLTFCRAAATLGALTLGATGVNAATLTSSPVSPNTSPALETLSKQVSGTLTHHKAIPPSCTGAQVNLEASYEALDAACKSARRQAKETHKAVTLNGFVGQNPYSGDGASATLQGKPVQNILHQQGQTSMPDAMDGVIKEATKGMRTTPEGLAAHLSNLTGKNITPEVLTALPTTAVYTDPATNRTASDSSLNYINNLSPEGRQLPNLTPPLKTALLNLKQASATVINNKPTSLTQALEGLSNPKHLKLPPGISITPPSASPNTPPSSPGNPGTRVPLVPIVSFPAPGIPGGGSIGGGGSISIPTGVRATNQGFTSTRSQQAHISSYLTPANVSKSLSQNPFLSLINPKTNPTIENLTTMPAPNPTIISFTPSSTPTSVIPTSSIPEIFLPPSIVTKPGDLNPPISFTPPGEQPETPSSPKPPGSGDNPSKSIPEPGSALGLLGLGALGAASRFLGKK